jgi:hypothetical protein
MPGVSSQVLAATDSGLDDNEISVTLGEIEDSLMMMEKKILLPTTTMMKKKGSVQLVVAGIRYLHNSICESVRECHEQDG